MRSKKVKKRPTKPDALYKSRVVSRIIQLVMKDGKKAKAENIVWSAIAKLDDDSKEALRIFEEAVKNVMPKQEVRSRRVGGATYQVPMPVKHSRSEALALRWLVGAAKKRQGKSMVEKLHEEFKNSNEGIGNAIKKRDETHKMAEANRAFSHFRF